MQAVMKHATLPTNIARITRRVMSERLEGAIDPRAPMVIPTAPKFEKPQRVYVAITSLFA